MAAPPLSSSPKRKTPAANNNINDNGSTHNERARLRRKLNFTALAATPERVSPFERPFRNKKMSYVPPNYKPTSQKAATMTHEPKAEDVEMLMMVSNASRDTAVRWLKVKQGNVESAMNAILDQDNLEQAEQGTTWDGGLFDADRNGNTNLHPLGTSAAPTRGNSPAPSGIEAPNDRITEDEDLAKAIANSQNDFGTQSYNFGLETGTIGADGKEQRFGPATKAQYDERNWALTVTHSMESIPDASIEQRIQTLDDPIPTPRFLKPSPDGDYTPNLLTICHAIPRARAALLAESLEVFNRKDYGYEEDWWKGNPISMPRVVSLDDNEPVDVDADQHKEFVAELQRLIAFLDSSRRVYASTRGLTETEIIKNASLNTVRSCSLVELVMNTWTQAIKSTATLEGAEQITGLFTTVIGTTAEAGLTDPNLTLADMTANCADDVADELRPELPELLDDLLWDSNPDGIANDDNYIESLADVVVMRLKQTNTNATHLNIKVPPYLNLGKYLKENVAATQVIRQHMIQGKKRIAKLNEIEKKMRVWHHSTDNSEIDASQLLKYTLGHFSGQNRKDADQADKTNNASLADNQPSHYPEVARKLQAVIASIDRKLEILAQEKEKTRKAISELSKVSPTDIKSEPQQYRYVLRGVATKPNTTYVLTPKPQQQLDAEASEPIQPMADASEDADSTPVGMQWWRLEYDVQGSDVRISRTKAEDYDVIRAIELEHNSALLVYANEAANDADEYDLTSELSQGLKDFITHDNEVFEEDINKSQREPPSYQSHIEHSGRPGGRSGTIWRTGSDDSMTVQFDNDASSDTMYDLGNNDPSQHQVSVGYGTRENWARTPPTPDAHEIHLDDKEDLISGDVEMTERLHAPLVPQQNAAGVTQSDTNMGGIESQDMGLGGSISHIENDVPDKGG